MSSKEVEDDLGDLPDRLMNSILLKRQRSQDNYAARVEKSQDTLHRQATELSQRQEVEMNLEEVWGKVAYGIDIVQQMLETPMEKRGRMGKGITNQFQMVLNSFVQTMQRCPGAQSGRMIQSKVTKVFESYLKQVALSAIKSKKGVEQLKEFAHRWECHKIFSEYIRRMFYAIDNGMSGSNDSSGGASESISALGLRMFKEYLWEIGKGDIVNTMLGLIHRSRAGQIDKETTQFLDRCKEILCVMGVVNAKHFNRIKGFVDHRKANRGRFKVMEELELIDSPIHGHGAVGETQRKIVVGDHIAFYKQEFQEPFLDATKAYLVGLREEWMTSKSVTEYFRAFLEIMNEENERVSSYLHESTREPLQRTVVQVLLENPTQTRLLKNEDGGLFSLLKLNKLDEVAMIYSCVEYVDKFKLKGGLTEMANIFGEFILREGRILIDQRMKAIEERKKKIAAFEKKTKKKSGTAADSAHDPDFIDALRSKFVEIKKIRMDNFQNEPRFTKAMTKAFETIVNHNWGKDAKQMDDFLVYYVDMIFKGKRKKTRLNSDDIKSLCTEILELFDLLNDKDRFLHTYKNLMVKRLLDPSYNEYTNESDVLAKLKIKVGASETATMESMLNDMIKVKEDTRKWHNYVDKECQNVTLKTFEPKVLAGSAWILPKQMVKMSRVPHQVERWIEDYAKYYATVQNSRQLEYRHDLSLVELSAKYGKKKYRIRMSAPQACVLLLFNSREKLNIPELQNLLQIQDSGKIKAILMTLLMKPLSSKVCTSGLLQKIPVKGVKPLPLTNKDEFCVHPKFISKLVKFELKDPNFGIIKAPPPPSRNFRLEAALVMTMKSNKTMETKDLIMAASVFVSKFYKPYVKEVKKVIEQLIAKKYMKRCEGSPTKLSYLA